MIAIESELSPDAIAAAQKAANAFKPQQRLVNTSSAGLSPTAAR
jgi:hypothetical protein